ncbi:glycerophosphodiester phosphodiesterase family protein [Parasphingorhabdus halotolerans]|uniref:Glycerophosphodiester phosphodiesterase n=1 Tax=Parasphingorhabdus halotolerans TaxID=2725558 RepID=A0A6H2DNT7_9SPHN|nr:glycerophosphodiester phosphodiesterase family protein [Parasphingorhabdus halotolerans]QJB69625.1 glycerophosphodiester phosphodiesterase [Parasphingorhabdus halotolerans]
MRLFLSKPLDSWLAPAPEPERVGFLKGQPYAHRGLHGSGILENSSAAFESAIQLGHGIECDVQAAEDGRAFVFHDYELDRLTDQTGVLARMRPEDIDRVQLKDGHGKIPRLRETLDQIAGRVPVLIEIKSKNMRVGPLCLSVRRALEGYTGKAAIMSFNPLVSAWFRKNAEHVVRGLVVTEEDTKNWRGRIARHRNLWAAKPDFLAYDVRDFPSSFAASQRSRGLPVVTWTVRTAEQERIAAMYADEPVYERPQS